MESSGAAGTDYSDQFIENIAKYISGKENLMKELHELLKNNEDLKTIAEKSEDVSVEDIVELLKGNGDLSEDAIDIVGKYFSQDNNALKTLLEQANKVEGMEEKLETLGNQLLIQGVIGGAAITALTGALAGTLAIGGVAGALMGGGLALAGLVALVAIVAIGYAIYQHRGEMKEGIGKAGKEVKEGAVEWGKAIKSLVKDFIDNLPTIQKREDNFAKLNSDLLEQYRKSTGEEQTTLDNKIEIIKMLQNKEQRSAIEKLVEGEEIKDFPKEDMKRLVDKGLSTHETDKKTLDELVGGFQSAITKDYKTVESFVQMIDDKVKEMNLPSSKVGDTSSEKVDKKEIKKL